MQTNQPGALDSGATRSPLLLSTDEARRELGNIGKTTIFALIGAGHLETVRMGRRTMVLHASVVRYVDALRQGQSAGALQAHYAVGKKASADTQHRGALAA